MKILCLRECACISQYNETPSSSVSLLIIVFVYQIDGYVSRITVRYWRLRSLPVNDDRVLPTTTPSGLSIGISLKMNLWRSFFAIAVSPVKKSISPFIIHDAGASPGWTRALITIARFFGCLLLISFFCCWYFLSDPFQFWWVFRCVITPRSTTRNAEKERKSKNKKYEKNEEFRSLHWHKTDMCARL